MSTYTILDPRTELPAGTYFIGDPCYVLPDDEWTDALESTRYFNLFKDDDSFEKEYAPKNFQNGVFARDGVLFACSATAYGDGRYPVTARGVKMEGKRCGVDAGMIAAIPLSMIPKEVSDRYGRAGQTFREALLNLGCIAEIDRPFHIHYSNGTISFGPVHVETGD